MSKSLLRSLLAVPCVLGACGLSVAQDVEVGERGRRVPSRQRWYYGSGGPGGYYGGYGGFRSSNPIEGARYGAADIIRSRGQAAESYTNAMINYEEARSRYIDNKMKWVETYWQRRRLTESEVEKDREKKREIRDRYLAKRTRSGPTRLNPSQLDPTTGKIYWPVALKDDAYYQDRKELEELFVVRAHTDANPEIIREIDDATRDLKADLREHIRDYPPEVYLEGQKFLDGLSAEAALPAG